MSGNEIIDSGIEMARMASAELLAPFTLRVGWSEGRRAGREDVIDLRPIILSYKVYRPLRDEKFFLTGSLAEDGYTIVWNGDDLEISADAIMSLADQAMTPADFSAFLARNKLTQEVAAALLGRSRRQIATYASVGPIPRIVALACYGFEARKREAEMAGNHSSNTNKGKAAA